MKIYRDINEIEFSKNTVVTTGTFDGIHLGHQLILKRLTEISKNENLRHVVITFEPHPQIVIRRNDNPVKLLTTINERIKLFESFGIEHLMILPFTVEFSRMNPETFVNDYLCEKIGVSKVLIGYDHMFGKNREGNKNLLTEMGQKLGFEVESVSALENESVVVSSTKIRHALESGDLDTANKYLGYRYFVEGNVVYGDRRGHTIGYPTANVEPESIYKQLPANGVYFVKSIINGEKVFGMANIGLRPTFTNNTEPVLEVFYLDFNKNIYNNHLNVSFLKFIRKEQKFASLEEFLKQLKKDEIFCRNLIPEFYI